MQHRYLFFTITLLIISPLATFAQEHTSLTHGGSVQAVAYSPINSSLIASAGGNHTVKLWDLEEEIVTTLGSHSETVNSIAFSPDGQRLVSASDDYTFKLWDVQGKRHLSTLSHITDNARSQIKAVTFSSDGQKIATAGRHVKIWDIHTLREIMTIRHAAWVYAVAFSFDSQYLAMGDASGQISIKNLRNQQDVVQFRGDPEFIYVVKFSPDDQTLACAGYNGGINLWKLPNWEQAGTLPTNGTVTDLSFSPDSSKLASANYEAVNLWTIHDGEKIATLKGHVGWVNAAAFSHDGNSIISGGSDGTLRLWDVTSYQSSPQDMVRIIYFIPNNRSAQPDMWTKLDRLIRDVQDLYADQMEANGFGRKTFSFETDENGETVVYRVDGNFNDAHYHANTTGKIHAEVASLFDLEKHVYLIVAEVSNQAIEQGGFCGVGGSNWYRLEHQVKTHGGYAVIPASGDCFDDERGTIVAAHELGHAFGLDHDFRDNRYIMSYGETPDRFSKCATEWLSVSRFFNTDQPAFNDLTTLQMLTSETYPPNATSFPILFQITDFDGIHQVQLLAPTTNADPASGTKLHSCKHINAQSTAVTFDIASFTSLPMNTVVLQVIDVHGNITRQQYVLRAGELSSVENPADVNADGKVDTTDLVLVAARFGETVIGSVNPNPDVNRDGIVDIIDLLLVVNEINSDANAAPAHSHQIASLNAKTLQQWIDMAKRIPNRDATVEKGIIVLEKLLAAMMPIETRLLENYPNPFNPETWIPYQLVSDADVTITIYDVRGNPIRTLDMGHQPAGTYYGRSSAAYWDGRNDSGESVASGLYFYTLSTGDFAATRKMLLRK
ncbi:MAG: dockerin type I domain-containing protein [Candidatus Poribacteria bacterium]|nr:dockerin type I domain-containing protein [Candidatus Poribacteria bacterium]